MMNDGQIIDKNKKYWNDHADFWFGTTALPQYGVRFVTEEDLHLFGDVSGKKLLEICCGSGHSLKYHANLICSPMEAELPVPKEYFDYVYSIYGIGWTTDLQGTFDKIASYLKKDGVFIFSWHHTLHYCVAWSCEERKDVIEDDKLVFHRSYFDESYFKMPVHDSEIVLCNRKISTYVNALAKAGFVIEQMIEQNDREVMEAEVTDDKSRKAKMVPISVCFKARKL